MEVFLRLFAHFSYKKPSEISSSASNKVIACMGDSFTYGLGASGRDKAYPEQLNELLKKAGSLYSVVNRGVPGDNSAQLLSRLHGVLAEVRPAAVIVLVGANNFWSLETGWRETGTLAGSAVLQTLKRLKVFRLFALFKSLSSSPREGEEELKSVFLPTQSEKKLRNWNSPGQAEAKKAYEALERSDYKEAEKFYRRAIALDKTNGYYYAGLAEVYEHQVKPQQAFLTAIEGVRFAAQGAAGLYAQLGNYYSHQAKDHMVALHWYEQAVQTAVRDGEGAEYFTQLVFVYFTTHQQERGLRFIATLQLPENRRETLVAILKAVDMHKQLMLWLSHDIEKMAESCRNAGAQLFLATYARQDDRFPVNDKIMEMARYLKLPLIDNQTPFVRLEKLERDFETKYFAPDGHCSDAGYAVFAEDALKILAANGFR
ncbi:MAG TPA: GDSL-type esterase/lipase family protein [Elusimicrobiales bacterium]|nr:GDSL-type esterase/lipase family protein [Elusimicrobiales bacterium]